MGKKRVLILGAAGRDFHNFNTVFRGDARSEVVAFTATQIPNIEGRTYPPSSLGNCTPTASRSCPRTTSNRSSPSAA